MAMGVEWCGTVVGEGRARSGAGQIAASSAMGIEDAQESTK